MLFQKQRMMKSKVMLVEEKKGNDLLSVAFSAACGVRNEVIQATKEHSITQPLQNKCSPLVIKMGYYSL